jgi:hypothetical protein
MNRQRLVVAGLGLLALLVPLARAQEKPKAPEEPRPATPIKVQIVLSEWEGDKKISSLPYSFSAEADSRGGRRATVRLGLRVPVTAGGKDGSPSVQYMDVGTDIDCTARSLEDGRYDLELVLSRSSLYSTGPERKSPEWTPGEPVPALARLEGQPIVRHFSTQMHVFLKDGQTAQSFLATDPVSGRVLKAEVTLNVLK